MSLKNRVQINTAYTQLLEIGELLLYALEIAAVVIVSETFFIPGLPVFRLCIPVFA